MIVWYSFSYSFRWWNSSGWDRDYHCQYVPLSAGDNIQHSCCFWNSFHYCLPYIQFHTEEEKVSLYFDVYSCMLVQCISCNQRVIKLTSPNMNYFIILGAYILYMSIFIRVLPSIEESVNFARCIVSPFVQVFIPRSSFIIR